MTSPAFALGVADVRAGRPFRYDCDTSEWGYGRGRQWATLVPKSVVLKRNGKITSEAVGWARRVFKDII